MASLKEIMEKDKTAVIKIGGAVVALLVAGFLLLRAFDVIGGGAPAAPRETADEKAALKARMAAEEQQLKDATKKGATKRGFE